MSLRNDLRLGSHLPTVCVVPVEHHKSDMPIAQYLLLISISGCRTRRRVASETELPAEILAADCLLIWDGWVRLREPRSSQDPDMSVSSVTPEAIPLCGCPKRAKGEGMSIRLTCNIMNIALLQL